MKKFIVRVRTNMRRILLMTDQSIEQVQMNEVSFFSGMYGGLQFNFPYQVLINLILLTFFVCFCYQFCLSIINLLLEINKPQGRL